MRASSRSQRPVVRASTERLTWHGHIVMSQSERGFFKRIFRRISTLRPRHVLEVGFGLGVSAGLIQKTWRPERHDIVEIDRRICRKARAFGSARRGVRVIHGNFWTFDARTSYHFIFYDPFEYVDSSEPHYDDWSGWAERICDLLADDGVVCLPIFGQEPGPARLPGLLRTRREVLRVSPYLLEDGSIARVGVFECWKRKSSPRSIEATYLG